MPSNPTWIFAGLFVVFFAVTTAAQAPPAAPEHKVWTIAAGAGLALTSGNKETSNVNAAYDFVYDPLTRNIVKSDGLMIRSKTDGELSANRIGLNIRDQYKLTERAYLFGQNQYLRDEFKDIDYLIAPSGGLGYKLLNTARTKLDVDGGLGAVWEKNPGFDVDVSGAVAAGEKLVQTLTTTTTFTQSFTGLWKTKEFADALYTFGVGIAAAMSTHTQLKFEVLDTYKNRPPTPDIQKNDVAVLMAIVYKM
jgi:putative salt-induced outer membrane protein YdiY